MALQKYKSWSLKDKFAGIPNPKELTNTELKETIKKINKVEPKKKTKK